MDSSFSDTSHAVEVVPMFAPSRMRKLELKESFQHRPMPPPAVTALLD
jgi:hypothetical protein